MIWSFSIDSQRQISLRQFFLRAGHASFIHVVNKQRKIYKKKSVYLYLKKVSEVVTKKKNTSAFEGAESITILTLWKRGVVLLWGDLEEWPTGNNFFFSDVKDQIVHVLKHMKMKLNRRNEGILLSTAPHSLVILGSEPY